MRWLEEPKGTIGNSALWLIFRAVMENLYCVKGVVMMTVVAEMVSHSSLLAMMVKLKLVDFTKQLSVHQG